MTTIKRMALMAAITLGAASPALQKAAASPITNINSNDGVAFSWDAEDALMNVARCFVMADQSTEWFCFPGGDGFIQCDAAARDEHWEILDWDEDRDTGATVAAINHQDGMSRGGAGFAFYGGNRGSASFADYYRANADAGNPSTAIANCWLLRDPNGAAVPQLNVIQ